MARAEASLSIRVECADCGIDSDKRRQVRGPSGQRENVPPIFLAMEPGPGSDGAPWFLCLWCWFEGLRSQNEASPVRPHVIVEPVPARGRPPETLESRAPGRV